ncbi:R3H domain-containing protein 2-like isoform X1 [Zingiber officinale]|uniref:R3H domain-containing protein 2-like isoform X1 n=1 Tax=Zingiber officinale TaxID=94328 RepID=UPI001C4C86BF|nr:R3H domain-containing protein 2-like isoform X1 [Zingiber officinale]
MASTQFAMVEELASLVKDNLYSKHLVLSIEETFVNFLQEDTSSDGILELQPMSPYHRLLLHRLADIFGFAHESVGEGDDRHLVLERCADTTVPPILVSDILFQYDDQQSLTTSEFTIRKNEAPVLKTVCQVSPSTPLEEREAAYKAARERIFSFHDDNEQGASVSKSRNVPDAARRMIAHALGQRIYSTSIQKLSLDENEGGNTDELTRGNGEGLVANVENKKGSTAFSTGKLQLHEKLKYNRNARNGIESTDHKSVSYNEAYNGASSWNKFPPDGSRRRMIGVEDLKKQQTGAARRIFANAMGLPPVKGNQNLTLKPNVGNRDSTKET